MNARLVGKGVGPDDCFVGLHHHAGVGTHHAAGAGNLRGVDVGGEVKEVGPGRNGHRHFFQGGVARSFANAVDGDLDLTCAAFDASQGVGRGQPQVVVAMGGPDDFVGTGGVGDEVGDETAVFLWRHIPNRVWNIQRRCPCFNRFRQYLHQKVRVRTARIFR